HWPRIQVIREAVTPESVEKGKSAEGDMPESVEKGKSAEGDMPECFGKYPTSWDASCYNCKVDVLCLVTSAYGRK
ncbi:MAG: hypothetical protein ACRDBM_10625, partial [Sporomusa sp.]